jgi:hypothetical protein
METFTICIAYCGMHADVKNYKTVRVSKGYQELFVRGKRPELEAVTSVCVILVKVVPVLK